MRYILTLLITFKKIFWKIKEGSKVTYKQIVNNKTR